MQLALKLWKYWHFSAYFWITPRIIFLEKNMILKQISGDKNDENHPVCKELNSCKVNPDELWDIEHVRFCLWDYVICLFIIELVS